MNRPLDLREWLQDMRLLACRYPVRYPEGSDEFALEALEVVENDVSEEYLEQVECIENAAPEEFKDKPDKGLEWLVDRSQELDEVADILDKNQKRIEKDIGNCVQALLDRIEDLEDELEALKAPAIVLPDGTALEHDL